VQNGESLADVARRYSVTVASMENANHLVAHAQVPDGFWLNVPTAPPAVQLVHYRVQRGDTLAGIADRFDVTVAELKRWNHISANQVSRGARLRIYAGGEPVRTSRAKSKAAENRTAGVQSVSTKNSGAGDPVQYKVKPGETLYSIARQYGVSISALRQSNPFLAERDLQAGDVLMIQR
jgi:LysM repeat protein